jgi:hypothetical protein
MQTTSSTALPAQLQVDGGEPLPVVPITSIDLMARRALKDEMPGIMLRGAIRSTAKAVAQYQLQRQAHEKDNGLLGLAAFALSVGAYVTESADERTWRTLPSEIAVARGRLPPGEHTITLQTGAGPRPVQINLSGRHAVVGLRLLNSQLFVQAPLSNAQSAALPPPPPSTPAAPVTLEEPSPAMEKSQ